MTTCPAVAVSGLSHRFGQRSALENITLNVGAGQLYAILGPNGGGKTTLFRLLSTLLPVQSGEARICGYDVMRAASRVRQLLGVVFQHPSLDRKLTVRENLAQHAALYGLNRSQRKARQATLLSQLGVSDRQREYVESLSGGLQRRVEIAKALLHDPPVLLMDEPTAGLDPAVRGDLWHYLAELRRNQQMTIIFTTHLLEEAERADRLAIVHRGKVVAEGSPESLSRSVRGQAVRVKCDRPDQLARELADHFHVAPHVSSGIVSWETDRPGTHVMELLSRWEDEVREVTVGQATLEDVFLGETGHRYWGTERADD